MDQPLSPLTNKVFSDLLEMQTRLRDDAEKKWQSSREFIHLLARQLAADWLDEQQRAGQELAQIPIEVLQHVLRERIGMLSMQSIIPGFNLNGQEHLQALKEANRLLVEQLEQANSEKISAQQALTQRGQEVALLKEKLENAQRPQYAEIDFEVFPSWYQDWVERGNPDRDGAVLRVLGDTGLSRQPDIFEIAARLLNIGKDSRALYNAVDALEKRGFITVRNSLAEGVGQPPHILTLTSIGESAYVFYAKAKPKPTELDLESHKSEAHALMVVDACNWLKKAGYKILRQAEQIRLDGGHLFCPDITAERDGKVIYVEVERQSTKGNQDREAKWRNFFEVSGGELYVVCQNTKYQDILINEINRALRENIPNTNFHYCDLSILNDDAVARNGDIWTKVYTRKKTK